MKEIKINDIKSLAHTQWNNCKYHIVFAPKYRRKIFYVSKSCAWQSKKGTLGKPII